MLMKFYRRYDSRYNINDNLGARNSWLWMAPRVEDILSNYGNERGASPETIELEIDDDDIRVANEDIMATLFEGVEGWGVLAYAPNEEFCDAIRNAGFNAYAFFDGFSYKAADERDEFTMLHRLTAGQLKELAARNLAENFIPREVPGWCDPEDAGDCWCVLDKSIVRPVRVLGPDEKQCQEDDQWCDSPEYEEWLKTQDPDDKVTEQVSRMLELNRKLCPGQYAILEDKRGRQAKAKAMQVIRSMFRLNNENYWDTRHGDETMTELERAEHRMLHDIIGLENKDKPIRREEPGIVRIALSIGYNPLTGTKGDSSLFRRFVSYVRMMANDPSLLKPFESKPGQQGGDLGGVSFNDLERMFGQRLDRESEKDNAAANQDRQNNGYRIIRLDDFEDAEGYAEYTGGRFGGDSCLCYLGNEEIWYDYTNEGNNTCYVCLRDGWDKCEPEPGPNCPFDSYGLSMIFLFVAPDGSMSCCNVRWNHEYAGGNDVDHMLTKSQVAEIVGVNFDSVFKPNETAAFLSKKMTKALSFISRGDASGFDGFIQQKEQPDIYKGVVLDKYGDRHCAFFKQTGDGLRRLSPFWFTTCGDFHEGLCAVYLNGCGNYLKTDGSLLLHDMVAREVRDFRNGVAPIEDDNYTLVLINTLGEIVAFGNHGDTHVEVLPDGSWDTSMFNNGEDDNW